MKKAIALRLLKSKTARRVITKGLKNQRVRSLLFKQISRRMRFR
ncbi:MAG TPA: hypothetical protein VFE21_13190 [Rubrobacteraceae bacterium]|nr:hypothetical protein [Rubrobacteraceae bacterium]